MKKKAVAVLGGDASDADEYYRSQIKDAAFVVAVDAGADILSRLQIVPDLLIGDMDSISISSLSWCSSKGTEIITFSHEKDEPDTELALVEIERRGISHVILLDFDGSRLDHFLATLMLMYRFSDSMNVEARSSRLNIGIVRKKASVAAVPGETWSILPIGPEDAVVTLKGFKYDVENRAFSHERPIGVSNIAQQRIVEISVSSGAVTYFRWIESS
ncbi:MAG TPA: thiamine diphosphokinase [Kosmotogaceae bacterium]|nr:MAG: Thiamine pyrophosphokinase [Thermotogales bacterium 46_20]HAA85210.1 thiamine diphosphokinase [Kosmotogaceae bacterium]